MPRQIRVPMQLALGEQELDRDAAHYVVGVHRLGEGDRFIGFDAARGLEAEVTLTHKSGNRVRVAVAELQPARTSQANFTLILALIKPNRLEAAVAGALALGAARIVLVEQEHSSLRRAQFGSARGERLRTLLQEAGRQCQRGDLPELLGPLSWLEWCKLAATCADLKLVLDPYADLPLATALAAHAAPRSVATLIGPEGGHAPHELAALDVLGFQRVRLGQFVLRSELAAVAALSALTAFREMQQYSTLAPHT